MFSWQPIPGENWLMTRRHSLMLTSSMLLLSRERPKINVYSQSSVVYISVYSVNHVLLCVCERKVPIYVGILSPVYLSTMFPVFWVQEISLYRSQASHCPIFDCFQYAVYCKWSKIERWEGLGTRLARPYPGSVCQRETSVIYCAQHSPYLYFLCMGGNDIHRERIFSSDVTDKCMCGWDFLGRRTVCKSRGPQNFETSYFGGGL